MHSTQVFDRNNILGNLVAGTLSLFLRPAWLCNVTQNDKLLWCHFNISNLKMIKWSLQVLVRSHHSTQTSRWQGPYDLGTGILNQLQVKWENSFFSQFAVPGLFWYFAEFDGLLSYSLLYRYHKVKHKLTFDFVIWFR